MAGGPEGPIHLSEVPLSHLSATHWEPRAVAAVPCSGLSGRVQSAPGGRSRLVATIVLLDATAETEGGAPEPSELAWPSGAAQGAASPAAVGTGPALLKPI